jgi:thiamine-phosphate pyrophosphorylase
MNPFVAAQTHALVENIRLLEAFVTAPLGLYSDIRMLREALKMEGVAALTQSESQQRCLGYRGLTSDHGRLALRAALQIEAALVTLASVTDGHGPVLKSEWISQAQKVIARVLQRVGGDVRNEAAARVRGLYVIVDPEVTGGRPVLEVARAALEGGAQVLQYRNKTGDAADVLPEALEMGALCQEHGALFIMNDDPTLAAASRADGLHVGQQDLPVPEARPFLGWERLVGRSNNNMDEVSESVTMGADYLAVGAVFPTSTMGKSTRTVVGPDFVRTAKQFADQPIIAIGGINEGNVGQVVAAGADCICVVGAVTLADDSRVATKTLVEAISNAK